MTIVVLSWVKNTNVIFVVITTTFLWKTWITTYHKILAINLRNEATYLTTFSKVIPGYIWRTTKIDKTENFRLKSFNPFTSHFTKSNCNLFYLLNSLFSGIAFLTITSRSVAGKRRRPSYFKKHELLFQTLWHVLRFLS